MHVRRNARFLALLLMAPACRSAQQPAGVLVFAAASTADALQEHAVAFEAASHCRVTFSFASSQDLARQIKAGAPADLFVSADAALIDDLVREGRVAQNDTARWMSNQLVIIVPHDEKAYASAKDLTTVPHLALGDPERVPAGRYARVWLQNEGQWGAIQAHVIPALDVRAALAMVEAGRAEAGVVYRTDAAHSARVRVTYEVPRDRSPPIVYGAARLARTPSRCARELMSAWGTPEAREMFAKHGFLP